MTYTFHPAAEAEFLESIGYYEASSPGLGAAFIDEFDVYIKLICSNPAQWQVECSPDIRRALLQRFPFSVIYRERGDRVQVLAVAHHRRRPQYWVERR